ncbi:hypothetical protein SNEBB_002452 [Seison nebaliae]|nr:hypothetical protein SNEBB_002452 [Seison nebaliae]
MELFHNRSVLLIGDFDDKLKTFVQQYSKHSQHFTLRQLHNNPPTFSEKEFDLILLKFLESLKENEHVILKAILSKFTKNTIVINEDALYRYDMSKLKKKFQEKSLEFDNKLYFLEIINQKISDTTCTTIMKMKEIEEYFGFQFHNEFDNFNEMNLELFEKAQQIMTTFQFSYKFDDEYTKLLLRRLSSLINRKSNDGRKVKILFCGSHVIPLASRLRRMCQQDFQAKIIEDQLYVYQTCMKMGINQHRNMEFEYRKYLTQTTADNSTIYDIIIMSEQMIYLDNKLQHLKLIRNCLGKDGNLILLDFSSIGPPYDVDFTSFCKSRQYHLLELKELLGYAIEANYSVKEIVEETDYYKNRLEQNLEAVDEEFEKLKIFASNDDNLFGLIHYFSRQFHHFYCGNMKFFYIQLSLN